MITFLKTSKVSLRGRRLASFFEFELASSLLCRPRVVQSYLHPINFTESNLIIIRCRLNVDFVTSRGNLARILNVLNGKDGKGWTLLATRYRGTVYLSHIEANNDKDLSPFGRRVCYWGKRFEVEVTNERAPNERTKRETLKHGPIKAYPGFFSVVRFQLENHTIALRTEVDAENQVRNIHFRVLLIYLTNPRPWAKTRHFKSYKSFIYINLIPLKPAKNIRSSNNSSVGKGGDRGVTISRFPYPVLPPPVPSCHFVSRLPPFIVFLPLSCK